VTSVTHGGPAVAEPVVMDERAPHVWLGPTADDSIAVSIFVLVRDGARQRPDLAASMGGVVRMRFADGYPPVLIDFAGDAIAVADDLDDERPVDLELRGRLGDIAALVVAPLAGGLPNPATRPGRQAIVRLADGRVDLDGPLHLARDLLKLLAVDAARRAGPRAAALARAS
jgi:hypothetical protein